MRKKQLHLPLWHHVINYNERMRLEMKTELCIRHKLNLAKPWAQIIRASL